MKTKLSILFYILAAAAPGVDAAPVLTTGTPANSYLSIPTKAVPSFGMLFNLTR